VHIFLTAGVTMLIWRVVKRATPDLETPATAKRKG
jgi:hypothetical protein